MIVFSSNSCGFDNRTKHLNKANTGLRMETFGNKTSFVMQDQTIGVVFKFKNLIAIQNMFIQIRRICN